MDSLAGIKVTFAASAVRDLEEMLAWYERQVSLEAGKRLTAEIIERIESLADNPDIGRIVAEFGQQHIRELIEGPFRIVYKREKALARVVRVGRSERLLRLAEEGSD